MATLLRISVVLCTFNGERYLRPLLASVSGQEDPPAAMTVVDDHSTDATWEILEEFAAKQSFPVDLHRNPERLGYVANFSRAVGLATEPIIAFCDQDDLWYPSKLRVITEAFRDPQVVLFVSDADLIDEVDRPLDYSLWDSIGFSPRVQRQANSDPFRTFIRRNPGYGMTVAVLRSRSGLVQVPPAPWGHDNWAVQFASAFGQVHLDRRRLVAYRQHDGQVVSHRARKRGFQPVSLDPRRGYEQVALRFMGLAGRLRSGGASDRCIEEAERAAQYFSARANLPDKRLLRIPALISMLTGSGHAQYSNGIRGILRDALFRGTAS